MFRIETELGEKAAGESRGLGHSIARALFDRAIEIDSSGIRYYYEDTPAVSIAFRDVKEVGTDWIVDRYGASYDLLYVETYTSLGPALSLQTPTFSAAQLRSILKEIRRYQSMNTFIVNKRALPGAHDAAKADSAESEGEKLIESALSGPELELTATKIVLETRRSRKKAATMALISAVLSVAFGYPVLFEGQGRFLLLGFSFSIVFLILSAIAFAVLRAGEETYFVDSYGVRKYRRSRPILKVEFADVSEVGVYKNSLQGYGIYMDSDDRRFLDDISVGFPMDEFKALFLEIAKNARSHGVEINDPFGWLD